MEENAEPIRKIIKEAINKTLNNLMILKEIRTLEEWDCDGYIRKKYPQSLLNEMARINKKEFYGFFPYNKFELKIWSNDHNPPHFHVFSDGWDIIVGIEDGEILRVNAQGKSSKIYKYIEDNIKDWLDSECIVTPKLTNRENAMSVWEQIN